MRGIALGALTAALTWLGAMDAAVARVRVLHIYLDASTNAPIVASDPLEAMEFLSSRFGPGGSNIGWGCPGAGWITPTSGAVTGRSMTVTCPGGTQFTLAYASATVVALNREGGNAWVRIVQPGAPNGAVHFGFNVQDEAGMHRFAQIWRFLGTRRAMVDPAQDAEFQSLLQAATPVDSEQLRRTQVQAEALLRENRNIQVASIYRDALQTSPGWADGRYNLGLVYGALELYPEAITEMRRYLYLSPNAPDARAVQDQIYQWEALLPAQ